MGEFDKYNDMLLDAYLGQNEDEEIDLYEFADQIRDEIRDNKQFEMEDECV